MPLAFILLASQFGAPDPSLARLMHATTLVRAGDRAVGTGWVADTERRWIVTARHVVRDAGSIEVCFLDSPDGRPAFARDHYLTNRGDLLRRGQIVKARVVRSRDEFDLALLVVDQILPDVPALPLSAAGPVPGETCRSVGHRHDSELLWGTSRGCVRQAGRFSDGYHAAGKKIGGGAAAVLTQLPVEAGESGAAVVNAAGEVVGVMSAVAERTPGVGIAIGVGEVRALLADARKEAPPPPSAPGGRPRADAEALSRSTVWVRPQATEARAAGVLIDRDHRLILTSAAAVGGEELVDVVVPKWAGDRLVAERTEYQDLLGLRLSGNCIRGFVLARDSARDLALIELHSVPKGLAAVRRSATAPAAGDPVAGMTHPIGEELLWLYAAGTVRSVGPATLERDPRLADPKPDAIVLQLPHQGSSSGGGVVNERGELVGVLSARDGARQELAYAATISEVERFLTGSRPLWDPRSAAEWNRRALFLRGRAEVKTEIAAHAEAARLAPNDPGIRAAQARALAIARFGKEARAVVDQVEKLPDRTPGVDATLADAFRLLGDTASATRLAESVLTRDPKQALALVSRSAGRPGPDALLDLDEAIHLDPSCAPAYRARAERARKTPSAEAGVLADLGRAIELAPLDPGPRILRAEVLESAKEFKKAAKDWTRLTELDPGSVPFHERLADAQLRAGDESGGLELVVAVLRLSVDNDAAPFRLIDRHADRLHSGSAGWERVLDWDRRALNALRPWVSASRRAEFDHLIGGRDSDEQRAATTRERIKAWGRGPEDRPRK
ncbi:MAG TPA: trypsin-like peptidase domain-containing protein [Gemmataceae bacterium]|nr:trypsin-like peptidase domain-containing protein [Gemmataceae bacterium]